MREIERFLCRADSGQIYTVVARAEQIRWQPLQGSVQFHDGLIEFVLQDGRDVIALNASGDVYQIVLTDEILHRVMESAV